jgi:hypothetical protein
MLLKPIDMPVPSSESMQKRPAVKAGLFLFQAEV